MRFSLTNEDILTAYNARLDHVCRAPLRYALVLTGFLGMLGPLALYLCHAKLGFGFMDLVYFIAGAILVRAWLIVPLIKRHRIRGEHGAARTARVIIDENGITEESGDTPKDAREWQEIDRIHETPKGFIIHFHDGALRWLPIRVFENKEALDEFLHLAARKDKL